MNRKSEQTNDGTAQPTAVEQRAQIILSRLRAERRDIDSEVGDEMDQEKESTGEKQRCCPLNKSDVDLKQETFDNLIDFVDMGIFVLDDTGNDMNFLPGPNFAQYKQIQSMEFEFDDTGTEAWRKIEGMVSDLLAKGVRCEIIGRVLSIKDVQMECPTFAVFAHEITDDDGNPGRLLLLGTSQSDDVREVEKAYA